MNRILLNELFSQVGDVKMRHWTSEVFGIKTVCKIGQPTCWANMTRMKKNVPGEVEDDKRGFERYNNKISMTNRKDWNERSGS